MRFLAVCARERPLLIALPIYDLIMLNYVLWLLLLLCVEFFMILNENFKLGDFKIGRSRIS